ncbi:MAG TPA: type I methionyl aminopeptidase [Ruminococcaceae bacterium]|nr:type I methionyl aminopeptidase [Oscillospiraceae bacterium]
MIIIKTQREIELMKKAGRISATALKLAGEAVRPGVSTHEIDRIAHEYILSQKAKPNFLHYNGFPAAACISVNEQVIHGIPSKRRILKEGDIVSIDLGAVYEGYHGDNAATFAVGRVSPAAQRLIDTTRESLYEGIKAARVGGRVGDIGYAIQRYVEARGYSVVRQFVGHGVGASLHEAPEVPNFGTEGRGARLLKGMTLAIEPMVNMGVSGIDILSDGWTVVTADRKLSAHFEHSVAITDAEPLVLTPAVC